MESTAARHRLPDVIGIGCRRCGSSWLHEVLNQHSQIGKPEEGGLHFFSDNFDKGIDWYIDELYPYSNRPVLMELSVSYMYPEYYERVAERIHLLIPEVKLFAVVRNPVDRAFSDYLRSIRQLEIPSDVTFENAIETDPAFLERGLYAKILTPFWDLFPKENICILFYDDLLENRGEYIDELLHFIGVDPAEELSLERREPAGKKMVSARFNQMIYSVKNSSDRFFRTLGIEERWEDFKFRYQGIYQKILALNEKKQELAPASRERLIEYYSADIDRLAGITGRDLSDWERR